MIIVKSNKEIEYMREAGKIVAYVHEVLKDAIKPGLTTKELDEIAEREIVKHKALPAFKGYHGFPASICASVNEEVVHGIPGLKTLKDGDIISIDIGTIYNGYYGDAAKTHPVGKVSTEALRLIEVTRQSFYEGLRFCMEGNRLSDVSHAIQTYVEGQGFSVVRDFVGHGIGQNMHEDPQIPNFGLPGKGPRLGEGMVLAIEPMVNMGTYKVKTLLDNWTVVTLDGKMSAHYEHTLAITKDEPMILTSL
ncbi:methionyl aminopeptidase [Anaerosolibacter carboniphilus]|uniref:Methionine aminopeptidase n=1 Tax=Anaerosolibacter carboniphilus TaxID=1417629 RepID=A0A841L375_9FIRM|nr:type I methionyl aminopeptidase [Anaerosolibacter carboniphilus]MBB6216839.1 methionyl aminopeptidase [Anaerosolibacter carboniphilus]